MTDAVKTASDSRAPSPTLAPSHTSLDKEMRDEKLPGGGGNDADDEVDAASDDAEPAAVNVETIRSAADAHPLGKIETSTSVHHDGSLAIKKTTTREDGSEYPTGARLGLIMLALCLAVFLMALDNSIIATAIPKITDQFHSLGDVGWYGSAYLLTTAALQLPFGKAYTYGRFVSALPLLVLRLLLTTPASNGSFSAPSSSSRSAPWSARSPRTPSRSSSAAPSPVWARRASSPAP